MIVKNELKRYVVLLIFFISASLFGQEIERGPFLQKGAPTSMTIMWRTTDTIKGVVYYGKSVDSLIDSVSGTTDVIHEINISGLLPDTKYYYKVTCQTSSTENQYFITSPQEGMVKSTNILVVADYGQVEGPGSEEGQRRINIVNTWKEKNGGDYHADLVISLGDQTEESTDSEYRDNFIQPLKPIICNSPLYTIIGNHDTHDRSGNNYHKNFVMPSNGEAGGLASGSKDFYSFNYANIHFIVLSTETKYTAGLEEQAVWLEKDLKHNKLPWIVVSFHRPIHSGGHHNTDGSGTATKQRNAWLGLLQQYGVDLILTGHNHVYERSMFIKDANKDIDDIDSGDMLDAGFGRADVDKVYYKKTSGGKSGYIMLEVCAPNPSALIEDYDKYKHVYKVYGSSYEVKHDRDRMSGFVKLSFIDNVMNVFTYSHDGAEVYDYFTVVKKDSTTGVSQSLVNLPQKCSVSCYPNPFNPSTKIHFEISKSSNVKIDIFNIIGKKVVELVNDFYISGSYNIIWEAKDSYGNKLPSGIYVARITAGTYMSGYKMQYLK